MPAPYPEEFKQRAMQRVRDGEPVTELVADALDMALWRRQGADGCIHHSDHGCQYTSWAFGRRLREAGLRGSMGSVGDAYIDRPAMPRASSPPCRPSSSTGLDGRPEKRWPRRSSITSKRSTTPPAGTRAWRCSRPTSSNTSTRHPRPTPRHDATHYTITVRETGGTSGNFNPATATPLSPPRTRLSPLGSPPPRTRPSPRPPRHPPPRHPAPRTRHPATSPRPTTPPSQGAPPPRPREGPPREPPTGAGSAGSGRCKATAGPEARRRQRRRAPQPPRRRTPGPGRPEPAPG